MTMNYVNELNEKQYEAVTAEDRFLRIIAGAGSGKTRVLTYRIAYLIERMYVRPSSILAITFTNKVAKEMKERTLSLLPGYDLNGLIISTFHSWCARFLRSEIEVLGFPRNYIIYDDDDQMRLIKEIGARRGYKKGDEKNKAAFNFISKQKTLGKLPSDLVKSNYKGNEEKEFIEYFQEYEKAKNDAKALDFDDLLIYALKILKNFPEVRYKYQSRYHDILVDEFQDTNDLQFELLSCLVGPDTNIYVVGDPDQTIYTWRGANQKIILDIDKIYQPMRSIVLNQNYRSTTEILSAANKLINNNIERLPKDLFTDNKGGKPVTLKPLESAVNEANYIATTIESIIAKNSGVSYKDFAILYRSSYLSLKIENALTMKRLPYNVYGGLKFYSRKEIKDCLAYFRLIMTSKDNVSFDRIINVPRRGFGDKTIETIKREAESHSLACLDYLESLDLFESELKEKTKDKLRELVKFILDARNKIKLNEEAYSEVLDQFLTDIGYYDYLDSQEDNESSLENVKALIEDVRTYLKTHEDSSFDEYLQNITLLTSQDDIDGSDKISLMTVHTAKGLEYNYVFVLGLNEGVFPNQRAVLERAKTGLEEERRLAYVAFTRAKKELYLTYNKDYSYVTQAGGIPSRFIKEAGIEIPSFNINSFGRQSNERNIYRYDFDKYKTGSGIVKSSTKTNSNSFVDVNQGNNIEWSVGDAAIHKAFGIGKVLHVENGIITVDFVDFGTKKLLGSHKSLSKKED